MKYVFIIDTDSYAGNFSREISAFCTGVISEYGPVDIADDFKMQFPEMFNSFENKVNCGYKYDDDVPCPDPCSLFATPFYVSYDVLGTYKTDEIPSNIEELYREAIEKYYLPEISKYEQKYALNHEWIHTLNAAKNELERLLKTMTPNATYNSVGIHFFEEPTKEEIQFMKNRAFEFAKLEGIVVNGFRLSTETVVETIKEV